jgi:uncharacterized protein YndB with AHSA1/START domain
MPKASYSVTVNRPVADVFEYVVDGEKCKEWRPGVRDITRAGGSMTGGVGTRYIQGVKGPMGRRISADYEITVFEPNQRLEFRTVSGPARPHGRYDFTPTPDGAGTNLKFALDAELSGIRRMIMGGAVQRTMDEEVKALDNLKRVLES